MAAAFPYESFRHRFHESPEVAFLQRATFCFSGPPCRARTERRSHPWKRQHPRGRRQGHATKILRFERLPARWTRDRARPRRIFERGGVHDHDPV